MAMDMLSLHDIHDAVQRRSYLSISAELVCYCDCNPACGRFAASNFLPKHFANDIMARDFDKRTYACTTHDTDHAFPEHIDIYSCCFPCGPWSVKGNRLGFNDRDGKLVWQAVKTVETLRPGAWYMENVAAIDSSATSEEQADASDLEVICSKLRDDLPMYWMACHKHIEPTLAGYPSQRDRVAILGVRGDLAAPDELATVLDEMCATPVPVIYDWRQFLGFPKPSAVDLARVGKRPNADEQAYILRSGCQCQFDPALSCPKHPCHCKYCRSGEHGACKWRSRHERYIKENYTSNQMQYEDLIEISKGLLTYVQVAEMQGAKLPTSQRERNMINLLAAHSDNHPLSATLAVMDKEQSIGRNGIKRDGRVGAMGTNASIFSLADAATLTTAEKAKLMGHELSALGMTGVTETQFRKMLGMSLHRGTAGMIMIALLASLGS